MNNSVARKVYYFGNYERHVEGNAVRHLYRVTAPSGLVAIYKKESGTGELFYAHTDHLGSITAVTGEGQSVKARYYYDAWGNRKELSLAGNAFVTGTSLPWLHRGYTGHKHIEEAALVNMNGRVYDPLLGRFLSPDPYVQAPDMTQNFNRYAYCLNNPLIYTDPSGEFITWSISNGGFSIGLNFTPAGVPLGFGINVGWADGTSLSGYGEVAYRIGGTGLGTGVGVSQSIDFNFKHNNWSTTTSEFAYASFGLFNAGASLSQTYDITNNQWSHNWGVSAGIGIGNDNAGIGLTVGYGSGGWTYGLGGYFNPERPEVYKSPISNNYGNQDGECVLRCVEEFSDSYGMGEHDYNYWLEQNEGKLGVHGSKVEGLIDNTGVYKSDRISPHSDINVVANAFTNDKRVLMAFKTASGGEHAVMVRKVKIWSSGRYRIYFSETSPVRLAPYSTTSLYKLTGAGFWTFYRN